MRPMGFASWALPNEADDLASFRSVCGGCDGSAFPTHVGLRGHEHRCVHELAALVFAEEAHRAVSSRQANRSRSIARRGR